MSRPRSQVSFLLHSALLILVTCVSTAAWDRGPTAPDLRQRGGYGLAYDALRDRIVIFGGSTSTGVSNETWELDGTVWYPGPPAPPGLSARSQPAMTYDAGRQRVTLFGGVVDLLTPLFDDAWTYDGQAWTQLPPVPTALTARFSAHMTYDAGRNRVQMFGGTDGNNDLNELWEYDGAWLPGPGLPSGPLDSRSMGFVYDPIRARSILVAESLGSGPLEQWVFDGAGWSSHPLPYEITTISMPAMAFDESRGRTILFGNPPTHEVDTWEYDGTSWHDGPATHPEHRASFAPIVFDAKRRRTVAISQRQLLAYDGARWTRLDDGLVGDPGISVVYDSIRRCAVLYSGRTYSTKPQNEVWEFDGAAWTPGFSSADMTPRRHHGAAFDPARGRMFIYGGFDGSRKLGDSWEYDGSSWQPGPSAALGMAPREHPGMTNDDNHQRVVVFGGESDAGHLNDTWELAPSGWQPGPAAPAGLLPRSDMGMSYDPVRGRVVVFGGWSGATRLNDTWEYDGTTWTPGPAPPPGLTARHGATLVFDPDAVRTVLVGGSVTTSTSQDDVWEYDGTSWAARPNLDPDMHGRYRPGLTWSPELGGVVLYQGWDANTNTIPDDTWVDRCASVAPASLPDGAPGTGYSVTLSAQGGTPPYSFWVSQGALPPGLTLSPSGTLSGIPSRPGCFEFVARTVGVAGCAGSRVYRISIGGCSCLEIGPLVPPDGEVDLRYELTLDAAPGLAPFLFFDGGGLPPGLWLSPSGRLRGTPTRSGNYATAITATDALGCSATRELSITIHPAPNPPLPNLLVGLGSGPPNPNRVSVLKSNGVATGIDFMAYAAGTWGVRVAAGDIDTSVYDEILTGPGPAYSMGPQVRAFRHDGRPIAKVNFYAYGSLRYGVNVKAGSLDSDAFDEIVTGAGAGYVFGPHVRGWNFDGQSLQSLPGCSFFAYGTLHYGAIPSTGNVDGDTWDELLTGPGPGPAFAPTVRGFDYDGGSVAPIPWLHFDAFKGEFYGAHPAGGDVNQDGRDEIACGQGAGPSQTGRILGFERNGGSVRRLPGFETWLEHGNDTYGAHVDLSDLVPSPLDGRSELIGAVGPHPALSQVIEAYEYDGTSLKRVLHLPGTGFHQFGANVVSGVLSR